MDIQVRKLALIEEFLRINDESLIAKLETFIKKEKNKSHEAPVTPMSLNDLHEMIDQAKSDSDAGRIISHQDLKNLVKTWK